MRSLFRRRSERPEDELRDLLGGYEPPSFPAVAVNVLGLLRDSDSALTEIGEQIEMDPGMHVRVLKTVNSAAFGLNHAVGNIHHAVSLLGRSRTEALVLSLAVRESVSAVPVPSFDLEEFWRFSSHRAALARRLAGELHPSSQAEAFTAGLLQDMAIPVMVQVRGAEYLEVWQGWLASDDARLDEAEREALGYDHPTVGALLAEQWNLPDYLVNGVAGHHLPPEEGEVEAAVRLVNYIRCSSESDGTDAVKQACRQEGVGLDDAALDELVESARADADAFAALL